MGDDGAAVVLIIGVGGLGTRMVHEALERGVRVSVLVRDEARLRSRLGEAACARLAGVTVGDATDPETLDRAMRGVDAVLSGKGADAVLARAMAAAVRRNGVGKLCWPAGGTNLTAEDGVTPAYVAHLDRWPGAIDAYRAHQACIDAIREAGITYVVLCPGRMEAVGHRSADVAAAVRIDRPAGMFVSYEDAAWVMLEGALTDAYDNQLVGVATARP